MSSSKHDEHFDLIFECYLCREDVRGNSVTSRDDFNEIRCCQYTFNDLRLQDAGALQTLRLSRFYAAYIFALLCL